MDQQEPGSRQGDPNRKPKRCKSTRVPNRTKPWRGSGKGHKAGRVRKEDRIPAIGVATGEAHGEPPTPAQQEITSRPTRQNKEQSSSNRTQTVCDITAEVEAEVMRAPPPPLGSDEGSHSSRRRRCCTVSSDPDRCDEGGSTMIKVLLNRGATAEVIHYLIRMYLSDATKMARLFILRM